MLKHPILTSLAGAIILSVILGAGMETAYPRKNGRYVWERSFFNIGVPLYLVFRVVGGKRHRVVVQHTK